MKIEEVKKLQKMGFSLDEIYETYFKEESGDNVPELGKDKADQGTDAGSDADGTNPESGTGTDIPAEVKTDKKKDDFISLREEIKELKNNLFKQSSRENKEDSTKEKTDPILSAFNTIINGKEL